MHRIHRNIFHKNLCTCVHKKYLNFQQIQERLKNFLVKISEDFLGIIYLDSIID